MTSTPVNPKTPTLQWRTAARHGWLPVCAVALLVAHGAQAQESLTLRKIQASGSISLGYRDGSVPFSYLDARQRPIGYSMDLCMHIVDAVKGKVGLPNLEVKLVPVTTATRIPLVVNDAVDLECGVTTNTVERQKTVSFTITTFVAASRLVSKKSSKVVGFADLMGRAVVSTVGTTSIRHLAELNLARGLDMKILAGKDDAEAFKMIETDRAVAYAMDDVLLHSSVASAENPASYVISEQALSIEPYGIMLRKGDPAFKRLADEALVSLFKSGEIRQTYDKWFQSPIPPSSINLRLPMSAALRKAIVRPTDSGYPADYE